VAARATQHVDGELEIERWRLAARLPEQHELETVVGRDDLRPLIAALEELGDRQIVCVECVGDRVVVGLTGLRGP
jgi:hypothetical protein